MDREVGERSSEENMSCDWGCFDSIQELFSCNNKVSTMYEGNMEFWHDKTGGWMLIGVCQNDDVEYVGFD